VYLEMAIDFALPLRLLGADTEPNIGFPFRQLAEDEGVLFADRRASLSLLHPRQALIDLLSDLQPGVTEVTLRPAIDTPELRAITTDWQDRVSDHTLLVDDGGMPEIIAQAGVTLIGFRSLRDAMRRG
jgi:chitin disaccharide deacetylase